MKKIVPITKEITFRTMIGEMTEVSLEHTLELIDTYTVEGNLLVNGRYKMTEASTIEEDFTEEIPVSIELDEKYDTKDVTVAIDDFYYEIINENVLRVHVDIAVDNLELKEETREVEEMEHLTLEEDQDEVDVKEVEKVPESEPIREAVTLPSLEEVPEVTMESAPIPVEVKEQVEKLEVPSNSNPNPPQQASMNSIFSAFDNTEETFSTYYVYLVQENDTVDSIIDKYKTTRECLQDYNDLDDIKVGSKLIIPCAKKE